MECLKMSTYSSSCTPLKHCCDLDEQVDHVLATALFRYIITELAVPEPRRDQAKLRDARKIFAILRDKGAATLISDRYLEAVSRVEKASPIRN